MDMQLAYRIVSLDRMPPHPSLFDSPPLPGAVKGRMDLEAEAIAAAPKFSLNNVASFYAAHDRSVWDCQKDIPNWAPPFHQFFVEWDEPDHWNIGGKAVDRTHDGQAQVGFLASALPISDESRSQLSPWKQVLARFAGGTGELPVADEVMADALARSKWCMLLSQWSSISQQPLCGRPLWHGVLYVLFVAADGSLVYHVMTGPAANGYQRLGVTGEAVWSPIHIVGLGLSFCHCKNVRVTESPSPREDRWHRRQKVPVLKFHTINIDPMRETLRREGRSDEVGINRALHICRGHFASYTEEHPLFGKYVGNFWRPSHVRGQAANGAVVSDYAVKGGQS